MAEQEIGEVLETQKHYSPDHILTADETDYESRELIRQFTNVISGDSSITEELKEVLPGEQNFISFRKGKSIYRAPVEQFDQDGKVVDGNKFNLLRYDEEGSEEDLTLVKKANDLEPAIDYKLVSSHTKRLNRDYILNNGITVSGAREMLDRVKKDFSKLTS